MDNYSDASTTFSINQRFDYNNIQGLVMIEARSDANEKRELVTKYKKQTRYKICQLYDYPLDANGLQISASEEAKWSATIYQLCQDFAEIFDDIETMFNVQQLKSTCLLITQFLEKMVKKTQTQTNRIQFSKQTCKKLKLYYERLLVKYKSNSFSSDQCFQIMTQYIEGLMNDLLMPEEQQDDENIPLTLIACSRPIQQRQPFSSSRIIDIQQSEDEIIQVHSSLVSKYNSSPDRRGLHSDPKQFTTQNRKDKYFVDPKIIHYQKQKQEQSEYSSSLKANINEAQSKVKVNKDDLKISNFYAKMLSCSPNRRIKQDPNRKDRQYD